MTKPKMLFLSHRYPFPPDKGDKIRALNILNHLANRFEVFLGYLDGDAEGTADPAWASEMGYTSYCGASGRWERLARTGLHMLNGKSLSVGYFSHGGLHRWTREILTSQRPELVYIYSSAMAQYVAEDCCSYGPQVIMDFVDVDSVKWKQYAESKTWPVSWLYRLEAGRLLAHDRRVARRAHASLFVSEAEKEIFRSLVPESAEMLHAVSNGVDTALFDPQAVRPVATDGSSIVFVGVMDYWPNVEAVQWFASEVFPSIRERFPNARFTIVGSKPTPSVLALAKQPGIGVTGAVPDVRPFLASAHVVVAPLRIARGIQNKVLEGMAMAKPVVTTPQALEGICASDQDHALVAADAVDFSRKVVECLAGQHQSLGHRAREFVLENYSWRARLKALDDIIDRMPLRVHAS